MLIGIDFDNTIVCYDALFHALAAERGLISEADAVPPVKDAVRDHLRRTGREADWTAMQGEAYGARIDGAAMFPGVPEFLRACRERAVGVRIVSHKTARPYAGPPHDLHAAARRWLESNGFFDPGVGGLTGEDVHFEPTKQAKLHRIAAVGCTHFIDDLPEFLADPAFPPACERVLFDPAGRHATASPFRAVSSWTEAVGLIEHAGAVR